MSTKCLRKPPGEPVADRSSSAPVRIRIASQPKIYGAGATDRTEIAHLSVGVTVRSDMSAGPARQQCRIFRRGEPMDEQLRGAEQAVAQKKKAKEVMGRENRFNTVAVKGESYMQARSAYILVRRVLSMEGTFDDGRMKATDFSMDNCLDAYMRLMERAVIAGIAAAKKPMSVYLHAYKEAVLQGMFNGTFSEYLELAARLSVNKNQVTSSDQ